MCAAAIDSYVSARVDVDPSRDERGAGFLSDRDEHACHVKVAVFAADVVAQGDSGDVICAEYGEHFLVGHYGDVVCLGPIEHGPGCPEALLPLHDGDAAGEPGQKGSSSMAASPPPTTVTFWSQKLGPSSFAEVLTPRPRSVSSPGTPRRRGAAPIARMTARA